MALASFTAYQVVSRHVGPATVERGFELCFLSEVERVRGLGRLGVEDRSSCAG